MSNHMQTYSIWALLKFIIWTIIVSILYKYVNVYQSPILGLSFGYLWIFMILRWLMYFFFLWLYKLRSSETAHAQQTSFSYKLSLLFALFTMINITLMINDARSNLFGIITLLSFLGLIPLLAQDKNISDD